MGSPNIPREEYLRPDFDYEKLTKQQLRQIMSENGVAAIPPPSALKDEILDAYRRTVHAQACAAGGNISRENIFQAASATPLRGSKEQSAAPKEAQQPTKTPSTPKRGSAQSTPRKVTIAIKNSSASKSGAAATPPRRRAARTGRSNPLSSPDRPTPQSDRYLNPEDIDQEAANRSFNATLASLYEAAKKRDGSSASLHDSTAVDGSSLYDTSIFSSTTASARARTPVPASPECCSRSIESDLAAELSVPNNSTILSRRRLKKKSRFGLLRLLLAIVLCLYCYFRFLCPYCTGSGGICVPLPAHASLDGQGALRCDDGYRPAGWLVVHCRREFPRPSKNSEKARDIIRFLERKKGEYFYGYCTASKLPVDSLTSDPAVISLLELSNKVVINGGFIEAVARSVSFKLLLKVWISRACRGAIMLATLVVAMKLYLYRRRKENALKKRAALLAKEVCDILRRQVAVSSRSEHVRPFLYERQLRDALDVDTGLWARTRRIVLANSNIQQQTDDKDAAIWLWNGPILSDL
ncbi:hypothetical protein PAPHI01_2437 [Pancytospora philotis]|nr:hypothetical protein PAPHI01_2437 [Pancytospora philotis]